MRSGVPGRRWGCLRSYSHSDLNKFCSLSERCSRFGPTRASVVLTALVSRIVAARWSERTVCRASERANQSRKWDIVVDGCTAKLRDSFVNLGRCSIGGGDQTLTIRGSSSRTVSSSSRGNAHANAQRVGMLRPESSMTRVVTDAKPWRPLKKRASQYSAASVMRSKRSVRIAGSIPGSTLGIRASHGVLSRYVLGVHGPNLTSRTRGPIAGVVRRTSSSCASCGAVRTRTRRNMCARVTTFHVFDTRAHARSAAGSS